MWGWLGSWFHSWSFWCEESPINTAGNPAATENLFFVLLCGRERAVPCCCRSGPAAAAVRRDRAGSSAHCVSPALLCPSLLGARLCSRGPVCSPSTARVGKSRCQAATERCHCVTRAQRVPAGCQRGRGPLSVASLRFCSQCS